MITISVQCAHCEHTEPVEVAIHVGRNDIAAKSSSKLTIDVTAKVSDEQMADVRRRFTEHVAAAGHRPIGCA